MKRLNRLSISLLLASQAFGAYGFKTTVTIPGLASGSLTNFTVPLYFSDSNLKTVANGGGIQHVCTRNTYSFPCDFVFTNDSTCATVTGSYTWGPDGDYNAAAGTGHVHLMIPSYTNSAVVPTVCFGNAAVTTYQGGAVGAEFDANTVTVLHLPDGSAVSLVDSSANGHNGTNNETTAAAGKIDGGIGTTASTYVTMPAITSLNYITAECWFRSAASPSFQLVFSEPGPSSDWYLAYNNYSGGGINVAVWNSSGTLVNPANSSSFPSAGVWYHYAFTFDGSNVLTYVNGTLVNTSALSGTLRQVSNLVAIGDPAVGLVGSVDEARIASVARPANWIAADYALQNNPPVIISTSMPTFTPGITGSVVAQ